MQPAFWAPILGRQSPCLFVCMQGIDLDRRPCVGIMPPQFELTSRLNACIVQEVQPTEEYVLVIDADMIMRKAFDPRALGVGRGWAVSAFFSYMKVGTVQQMLLPLFMQVRASSGWRPVFPSCSCDNMLLLPVCAARDGILHEILGRSCSASTRFAADVFDIIQHCITTSRVQQVVMPCKTLCAQHLQLPCRV